MRSPFSLSLALVFGAVVVGCGGDDPGADSNDATAQERFAMPKSIVAWEDARGWGNHHLEWHTERRWDRLRSSDLDWATKQGWKRAERQEGEAGNGLEFLLMHRAMLQMLRESFPKQKSLFVGWTKVPTDPRDKTTPVPSGDTTKFDPDMLDALDKLANNLDQFESDDDLGLYIETKLRPTADDPGNKTDDASSGIHNYLHNRFMDPNSAIDVGDPSVNLRNKIFWRLHGWLDATWSTFREAKGLSDDDPAYQDALAKAHAELMMKMSVPRGTDGAPEPPPDSLTKMFETDVE